MGDSSVVAALRRQYMDGCRRFPPPFSESDGTPLHRPALHPRRRGRADDRRRRDDGPRLRDRGDDGRRPPRDRGRRSSPSSCSPCSRSRPTSAGTWPRRPASSTSCGGGCARRRRRRASRSAPPERTRSRNGRTSGSSTPSATTRSSTRSASWCGRSCLFGLHVHVGIDDPEKAIHVANGMRVHIPILLALSTNSPFWRGMPTAADVGPHADLPAAATRRRAAALRRLGRLLQPDRVHGRGRRGPRLHVPVVGRAAPSEVRHGRDPLVRRPDPPRPHGRARRR